MGRKFFPPNIQNSNLLQMCAQKWPLVLPGHFWARYQFFAIAFAIAFSRKSHSNKKWLQQISANIPKSTSARLSI